MRRGVVPGMVVVIALVALALLARGGDSTFRVDVEFDTAAGMVPGQTVKLAGAKVGTVQAVQLVRLANGGYRARLELVVDSRFAPLRADASCRILPEGLISENYVDCDPGTSDQALPEGQDGTPLVRVSRTATPLSLQSLLDVFAAPAPERLRILTNELGIATAARGEDLNTILRRAAPALAQTDRVVSLVARQRDQLADAVVQTDRVLTRLAKGRGDVRQFVGRAADVLDETSAHRVSLERAVRGLPPTLAAIRRAAPPLARATAVATPLLKDLRRAAPGLTTANRTVPTFTKVASPAVAGLGAASRSGAAALVPLAPVVGHLAKLATHAEPVARSLDRFLLSLRDSGGNEAALYFAYGLSQALSAYDSTSHFVPALALVFPKCVLENAVPNTTLSPGCSHAFNSPGNGQIAPPTTSSSTGSPAKDAKRFKDFLDYLLG